MIKSQLGEPVPGAYPKAFVERYPETASIVSTETAPHSCSVESVDKFPHSIPSRERRDFVGAGALGRPAPDATRLQVSRISGAELRQAIRRGWSKHCPHCGKGPLFIGWNKPHRNCPVCGYLYERDYGDVWWVWIVTDRIPVGIGIVLLYFGFRVKTFWMG
jgi:hypothetical protein